MGLASSQARLLTLTTRMHQIEYKAAKLEAEKLQMANESKRVYDNYVAALEATTIEKSFLNKDASVGYKALTALDIYTFNTGKQYTLQAMNGKMLIPSSIHEAFQNTDSLAGFLGVHDVGPEGTTIIHHDEVFPPGYNNSLAKAFQSAGSSCYDAAVNSSSAGCYAHVLAHIIDYTVDTGLGTDGCNEDFYNDPVRNNYSTSTGRNFQISAEDITGAGMDDNGGTKDVTMSKVSEYLNRNEQTAVLSSDVSYEETDLSSEYKQLASMYIANGNGETKTLKQWAEDLYYLCKNYSSMGISASTVTQTIKDFQKHLSSELDANYIPPYDETVDTIIAQDPLKAQWYSNIWNAMNNTDTSNISSEPGVYDAKDGTVQVGYQVISKQKNDTEYYTNNYFNTYENDYYIVIPDEMLNSPEWLTNMINNGYAILQTYDKREEILAYTSVAVDTDLREVPNEKELRKAEAQYEADMRRIDNKDRIYDRELAALEAERSAIKNEMETLKTVSKDNVERTFKLFG